MKKAVIISVIFLIFLGVLGFFGYNFIKDYQEDVKNTKEIIQKINDEYEKFEKEIVNYNKDLTKLIETLKKSTYVEKIEKNKDEIKNLMENVEKELDSISSFKSLNKYCTKKFSDGKTNRNCSSFSKTYEKSVNVYVDVVVVYNDVVKKYNELVDESKKIKSAESKYDNYIDYDKDGTFLGKDVANGKGVGND